MNETKLQMLVDRMEIINVFNHYATGIDHHDKTIYRSCFIDKIDVDVTGQGPVKVSADDWVDQAFSIVNNYETTQHIITNHTIAINGDEANAVAYLFAKHYHPENTLTVGGYYTNRLVRTPEGWKISSLNLKMTWTETA